MYIPHAADPEQAIGSCKVSSFESSRLRGEMLVRRGQFEGRESNELLCLWILRFEDDHRGVSFRSLGLHIVDLT